MLHAEPLLLFFSRRWRRDRVELPQRQLDHHPPVCSLVLSRFIDESRYLSRDLYRDTVCNNRDTRDLATFLRFLFECLTDINCQSAKNYQCRMSSHPQQTAGSYSQLKSIK